jgi:cytochrome c556
MRRLLAALVVLVAVAIGVGFYRGWFQFSPGGGEEKANPSITVDREKLKADTDKAKAKMEETVQKAKEKVGGLAGKEKKEEAATRP